MKSIITGLFLAGCCVPVALGAAQIVSAINAPENSHEFANLDTPLWSNTPTRVDREHQNYERLPALLAANTNIRPAKERVVLAEADTTPIASEGQQSQSDTERLRISWCQQRYSSYRVDDNSYQPFGGGPRRTCDAPVSTGEAVSQASLQQPSQSDNSAHIQWCSSHYASYQPGDNSYRAFSGARRQCTSPFAGNSANTEQASM